MLQEEQKKEIISEIQNGKTLSESQKKITLEYLTAGGKFDIEGDYLCCDLGIDEPKRYQWVTFEMCKSLGGSAADNDKCPDKNQL